ncbi:uncharacterized protein LOC132266233 [Cornus florida]|uniref:uncharacterized protein LOC132266233 n=1 Tax=Cornus florida TaxID=4283 RepID=UPI0028A17315|nr:uncharacterized protein LOC132266233 [Cornus florida]
MLDSLQEAHEGNKVIKENKIQLFTVQYEVRKMEERETIAEYMFKINDLVNNMRALGEDIKDSDVCKKILRSLTSRFNAKVIILEDKDLSNMKIDELQASLTAYEMRVGPPTLHRRETTLKAKENVEEDESKSEDDLEEDEVAYLAKKFRKFRFTRKSQLHNLTCYECGKPSHIVSKCPNSKGQNQRKFEEFNNKGRFGRKALLSDWETAIDEEKKLKEDQEDKCLFMAILEPSKDSVEEDTDTEIEEILEKCERLAVKCNQQKSQIRKLNSELLRFRQILTKHLKLKLSTMCSISLIVLSILKVQSNSQWSTKRCKEELSTILEERSLKMVKIQKQSTKQIGKTGIGYVCDSAAKISQKHSTFVKATTGEVYARYPMVKPLRSRFDIFDNIQYPLSFNQRDFVTSVARNFKITKMYMKKSDLTQGVKVKYKGSMVKSKMMWIPKKLNSISLLVYTAFKACNIQDKWYVDSGCSRHMTGDGSKLNSLQQFDGGNVIFGDNQRAKIVGIGTVSKSKELPEIQEVLLVEGLKHNLLTVSQLCDSGKEVCFNKEKSNMIDLESKQVLFSASRSLGNVYTVTEESQVIQCNLTTCDEAKLWHKKLSHLHSRNMSKILKLKAVKGLPNIYFKDDHLCKAYQQGKQTKVSFHSKEINSSKALDLIYMDLCGPTRTTSIGGSKYFMILIDDFSRMVWVYFLKEKSEAITHFIKFVNLVENERSCTVKKLRSDFGSEFTMKEFEHYCDDKGIKKEFSAVATP